MLYSEFVSCAENLVKISNIVNDGWSLKNYKDNVYLVKYITQHLEGNYKDANSLKNTEDSDIELELDVQSVTGPSLKFRKWEYHILYNQIYQVPVIYFNTWHSSGQLLSLDELWTAIHPNFQKSVLQSKWFTLTQQEHPYLFKPYFYFHPCHTENFLSCFNDLQCNKLITWLSSIGQIIWLKMDLMYGKYVASE